MITIKYRCDCCGSTTEDNVNTLDNNTDHYHPDINRKTFLFSLNDSHGRGFTSGDLCQDCTFTALQRVKEFAEELERDLERAKNSIEIL